MSQESAGGQEKTQAPTRQRLRKARREGQVARSRELTSCGMLLISSLLFTCFAPHIGQFLMTFMQTQIGRIKDVNYVHDNLLTIVGDSFMQLLGALIPPLLTLSVLLMIAAQIPGGMIFSFQLAMPKPSRLNPLASLGRIFSLQGRMESIKAILKCSLVIAVMVIFLEQQWPHLLALSRMTIAGAFQELLSLLSLLLLTLGSALIVIAFIDVPFQQWQYKQNLRMTKQEIKEERRNSEGRPEVKMRIRKVQYMMARAMLKKRIPKADVVLLNPTHYAVAICYNPDKAQAPYVIAKGQDEIAARIRELAVQYKKIMLTMPELTRAIYFSTQVDQEVPAGLYTSVAHVLSHVMQLKAYKEGRGKEPRALPAIDIPSAFKHE
jgi:flagellar biosynthetic protein FlhB